MSRPGDMVRAGGGPIMKMIDREGDGALCIFIDGQGVIRTRHHWIGDLSPWWATVGPRTLWPEATDLPDKEDDQTGKAKRRRRPAPPRSAEQTPKQKKKLKRSRKIRIRRARATA